MLPKGVNIVCDDKSANGYRQRANGPAMGARPKEIV